MACRGFLECLLKLLNFLMTLAGLAIVGYGIYLFVEYEQSSSSNLTLLSHASSGKESLTQLGRPLLMSVSSSSSIWDEVTAAWFISVFTGVGVLLLIVSCFGCIGASTRSGCCLSCVWYALLVILLILIELGCAAFMFFDSDWEAVIPTDDTGDFDMIYDFFKDHWSIAKWGALGIVVMEAVLFFLALLVKATNAPPEYDSDEEYLNPRQPLIIRTQQPVVGVPVAPGAIDQRPIRNDSWSSRLRAKYGMNTAYNPNTCEGQEQQPAEEKGRCSVM